MTSKRRKRNERGTAALELAIVLPILLLVVFSLIDFGRYLYVRISISSASIEVANAISRGGATDLVTIRSIVDAVSPGIAAFSQMSDNAVIAASPLPIACPNASNSTSVILTANFQPILKFDSVLFPPTASGSSTMKCLR